MKNRFLFLPLAAALFLLHGCKAPKKSDQPEKPAKTGGMVSSLIGSYQVTPDKSAKLGHRGQTISIETLGGRTQITVPAKWKIVSCVDQPLDWHFVSAAPDATLAFGWKVVRFSGNPPLEQRYQNYLDGIHRAYDPNVQTLPGKSFTVGKQKLPSYLYYSGYWGQRLVIIIPQNDITSVLEFTAPSAASFESAHTLIQKILSSYSYKKM